VSGILGILDRDGVDEAALVSAAAAASYRGNPLVDVRGPIGVGIQARSHEGISSASVLREDEDVLVADFRIDGTIPGSVASRLASTNHGTRLLTKILRAAGPDGLLGLAADFSLGWYDSANATLYLARDAFAMRPLFWAVRGHRFAFASDPHVLFRLGIASTALDAEFVARHLASAPVPRDRTPFCDVNTVLPGGWVSVDADGRTRGGRWFQPEDLIGPPLRGTEAVEELRYALDLAVRSRVAGKRPGLALSGGRDSASIAVALANAGLAVNCITQQFDADLPVAETGLAKNLAERLGHTWTSFDVPSEPSRESVNDLARWTASPCGYPGFPQITAPAETAADLGLDVLLSGEGADALFSAAPVAVFELIRRGQFRAAVESANNYANKWTYSRRTVLKAGLRAIAPHRLLVQRDRARPVPPWVSGRVLHEFRQVTAPRSASEHLLLSLTDWPSLTPDIDERLFQLHGLELAFPFADLRVVQVAVSLVLEERIPRPLPKPLLARTFLFRDAETRVKVQFEPYYRRLARHLQLSFPEAYLPSAQAVKADLVNPAGLAAASEPRWLFHSLALTPLEVWLRKAVL
jgi:asparagine synthetase B (glutamine-hydrolysing)